MVERLSACSLMCALLAAGMSAAAAQAKLPDPTRPPQVSAPAEDSIPGTPAGKAGPRLQSVLISPQRKLAVIDGRTVPLGGEIDGAKLVAVTEGGVTLRRGSETETLSLHPRVVKKAVLQ